MPVINPKEKNSNAQRTTFRPPWVKDGPSPLPMPSATWTPRAREGATGSESKATFNNVNQRQEKVIPITIVRETNKSPTEPQSTEKAQPSWRRDRGYNQQTANITPTPFKPPVPRNEAKMPPAAPKPPPPTPANMPPPPPPMAPLPPPMTDAKPPQPFVRKPISKEKSAKLEALRSRPRRRPDWSDMMKEVESGKKLKHVQCNDRSAPILPQNMKAKGQFVYESEKKGEDNSHHQLLKEIQGGVKLRKAKCNDRSKPNLDGLRKFRREMTIEEQLQKSVSMADVVAAAVQPDELDDIDKVRDDLQSAKQMLALELRNKEAMERENKRLVARLAIFEAELEKEKSQRKTETKKGPPVRTDEDERLISRLKAEAAEAHNIAKEMEQKYHATAEQLDNMRRKLESVWLRNQELENQLKAVSQGTPMNQLMRQPSKKFISIANGASVDLISDDDDEEEGSESESGEEIENENTATREKQISRELRLLTSKLGTFRVKQAASLKERRILREQLKKRQKEMREEKKKYKLLQKEVDKMARLMKDAEDDEHETDDPVLEEEEGSDTDSESEESEEEESEEELPRTATSEEKRKFLLERTKRHENRLASLKKGNNLMKANIERLQDDINKQREISLTLQEDLNNILADLG